MNISENDKRDLINLLEKNKYLPEKFRYLLFEESKHVELIWDQKSNFISNLVLPFQVIEHIDEPRSEKVKDAQVSFDFLSGRQLHGWTNKLIWGDNKFVVSSLKNGPMYDEIQKQGGVKLIYIDPPFSVGMNYSIPVKVGDEDEYEKKPSIIENFAYRNIWGKQGNSFFTDAI